MGFPTGDMSLTLCDRCGFLWNQAFDIRLNRYSADYEETQHCSPRFQAFAADLVHRLVSEFGVRHQTVLEIGCGKAEFLGMLCEAGTNRGIGIDPAVRPERLTASTRDRLQLIPELYREDHGTFDADVILCRHTLEHIPDVADFLSLLRRSLDRRPDTLVMFEVPDVEIVLRECRYWDIYYEHCSYFSQSSLVALFERCGFQVIDATREFDQQYLVLIARPSLSPQPDSLPADVESLGALARSFADRTERDRTRWRQRLQNRHAQQQRTVVWGGGSKCVAFLTTAGINGEVAAVVDINPHKNARFVPGTGHEVMLPTRLADIAPHHVLVMNSIYLDEVRRTLAELGQHPAVTGL